MAEDENKDTPENPEAPEHFELPPLEDILKELEEKLQNPEQQEKTISAAEGTQKPAAKAEAENVERHNAGNDASDSLKGPFGRLGKKEEKPEEPEQDSPAEEETAAQPETDADAAAAAEDMTEEESESVETAEEQDAPESSVRSRRRERKESEENVSWQESLLMSLHDVVYLLAVLMVVFILFFRIVVVSGSSMYSTLWNGDSLLVMSSVLYGDPEYGDIIVASKDSFNDGEPIIKRVIATEGQTVDIDFDAGIVYVDGVALEEDYTYTLTTVSEGVDFPLTVSEGCVFAMGDNRDRSRDSRYPDIGLIDVREILGKAVFLFWPGTGDDSNKAPRDFSRIGVLN